jgi:reversibly glycosylated polypeptide/UDP-arabinopyranose mutase
MKFAVVMPTNREQHALKWAEQWEELKGSRIIVVEDNPEPAFHLPNWVEHYSWQDMDKDLGEDAWIIPRRTAACRSYGFLKALQGDEDIIWTLDDDCYPEVERRGTYLSTLEGIFTGASMPDDSWWNTMAHTEFFPRGHPYQVREDERPHKLHMGGWSCVPDFDGKTQLANPDYRAAPWLRTQFVPSQRYFAMSAMNLAFRRELTPVMYQLLMGGKYVFDRFDDIWCGLFMKKVLDHLGWSCTSGAPSIHHSRASDPERNARVEAPGLIVNEDLWTYVQDIWLDGDTPAQCYHELAAYIADYEGPAPYAGYWLKLAEAMDLWARHAGASA